VTHETLRTAREKRGWTIEELSRRAGIRLKAAEHIEQGEFAELPAGLYCRSTIRSYAAAVGLNPQQVLDELGPALPAGEDPLDGLARRYGHSRKAEAKPAARVEVEKAPAPPALPNLADVVFRHAAPSSENADAPPAGDSRSNPDAVSAWWRPVAASTIDGLLLAAMGGLLVWLTAIACGTSVSATLRAGAPGIALVFALIVALYFVVFGGVGTATPGLSLMHLEDRTPRRTVLQARDVVGRACRSIFRDGSVLAE
jgi:transcriptional regulator with XRE-family HTH domain